MLKRKWLTLIPLSLILLCLIFVFILDTEHKKTLHLLNYSENITKDKLDELEKSSLNEDQFWIEHSEILDYEINYLKKNFNNFDKQNLSNEINEYIKGLQMKKDAYILFKSNDTEQFQEKYDAAIKLIGLNRERIEKSLSK